MIGNIETIELQIEENTYQITKLYARDSHPLYLKCGSILGSIFSGDMKAGFTQEAMISASLSNLDQALNNLAEKFSYDDVIKLFKQSSIKKNGKDVSDSSWNIESPLLIFELFAHILKLNVIEELKKKKEDLPQIIRRLTGLKISPIESVQSQS